MVKKAVKTWSTPVRDESRRPVPCALCGGEDFAPCLACEGFSYVRCTRCGLVQMNPQPEGAAVEERYRERHGEDYLAYELANEEAFLRLQVLGLGDAGFEKPDRGTAGDLPRVLDVGCATGALLAKLRGEGWETRGVEICRPQAEYGRRERKLDIRDLPLEDNRFPDNSFDAVLASHLIEHLARPGAFVREAHRILAAGGRLYLTTPNIGGFQARLFRGRWRSAIFDHLYLFSAKTLSALLEATGFQVERIATWGGLAAGTAPAPLKRLADRAAKRWNFGDVMILRAIKRAPQALLMGGA